MKMSMLAEERLAVEEGEDDEEEEEEEEGYAGDLHKEIEQLRGKLEEKADELDLQSDQLRTVTYQHDSQSEDVQTAMESAVKVQ